MKLIPQINTLEAIRDSKYFAGGSILFRLKVGELVKWTVRENSTFKVLNIDIDGILVQELKTDSQILIPVAVFAHSFKYENNPWFINYYK